MTANKSGSEIQLERILDIAWSEGKKLNFDKMSDALNRALQIKNNPIVRERVRNISFQSYKLAMMMEQAYMYEAAYIGDFEKYAESVNKLYDYANEIDSPEIVIQMHEELEPAYMQGMLACIEYARDASTQGNADMIEEQFSFASSFAKEAGQNIDELLIPIEHETYLRGYENALAKATKLFYSRKGKEFHMTLHQAELCAKKIGINPELDLKPLSTIYNKKK